MTSAETKEMAKCGETQHISKHYIFRNSGRGFVNTKESNVNISQESVKTVGLKAVGGV